MTGRPLSEATEFIRRVDGVADDYAEKCVRVDELTQEVAELRTQLARVTDERDTLRAKTYGGGW